MVVGVSRYLLILKNFHIVFGCFMLSNLEINSIKKVIDESLDKAEKHWMQGGWRIATESMTFDSSNYEPSRLPNHPFVGDEKTIIDDFIALVADMRGSSHHLNDNYDRGLRKSYLDSGLQRVYYETSALLPALAQTVKLKKGSVTEFLGDGVLAFFPKDDGINSIINSYKVAKIIVTEVRDAINDVLHERYNLPSIDIGVGLASSKAIVNLVGIDGNKHPKAFGECVFKATKLSSGTNEVLIDKALIELLPLPENVKSIYGDSTGRIFEHKGIMCGRLSIKSHLIF